MLIHFRISIINTVRCRSAKFRSATVGTRVDANALELYPTLAGSRGPIRAVIALQGAPRCRRTRGMYARPASHGEEEPKFRWSTRNLNGEAGPAGRPLCGQADCAHRDVQERSSLTTFNKLRPRSNRWPTRGEGLGSRFCACAERADVFVNTFARTCTAHEICTLASPRRKQA